MPFSPNQIIGGNFQDSKGNVLANGILVFQLNEDCVVNGNILICAGRTVNIPLDSNGNIVTNPVYSVWNNDQISPDGSFYLVRAYSALGDLVWGPVAVQVLSTTSPFNVGVWIP